MDDRISISIKTQTLGLWRLRLAERVAIPLLNWCLNGPRVRYRVDGGPWVEQKIIQGAALDIRTTNR